MSISLTIDDLEIIWMTLLWCLEVPFTNSKKEEIVCGPQVKRLMNDAEEKYLSEREKRRSPQWKNEPCHKQIVLQYKDPDTISLIHKCLQSVSEEIGHSETEVELVLGKYEDFVKLRDYFADVVREN
ncbi:MAG: hypothetical protein ACE37I_20110 [Rubinisphaera brasiliensis]|uniref:hypothetical protein n=1 Tax=Rubinisphaera brasiliensis TaxID=119 RepID=UPI00391C5591